MRTVQELLGHHSANKTMVCAHVLNRGSHGIRTRSMPFPGNRPFVVSPFPCTRIIQRYVEC